MSNDNNNVFKTFICFLLLWILIGYNPASTTANEQIVLEEKLEDYMIEQEENLAGLATTVIKEDEVIY